MSETNISQAITGNLENTGTDFSVDGQDTDGASDQKETTWMDSDWQQNLAYYKEIPENRAAIDAKARWTVGKGFLADPITTNILSGIRGNGKDTFNTILENHVRVNYIGGNSYSEIIRNSDGKLTNLKPLNPGSMRHVVNREGIFLRFEQISRIKGKKPKEFTPEKIFYLARNRIADEIHGISMTQSLKKIILARNEAMEDQKKLMHRYVKPMIKWTLDTDNAVKMAAFKVTTDKAKNLGEDIFIPKGAVEHEIVSVPTNATMNPLPWIDRLNQYFNQGTAVPGIIMGGATNMTEASAKIEYLAYQQTIEEEQLYLEEQVEAQLGLKIELEFPASLENELLSDKPKEEEEEPQANAPEIEQEQAIQPNDTTAEMEGKK